jgi:preprotein translocase subunit SecB
MEPVTRFPLRLERAFFKSVKFDREPEIPEPMELNFSVGVRVHDEHFPDHLQVDIKIETQEGQPLSIRMELIGTFSLVEGSPKPERDTLPDFINQQALHMLWPYITQMARQITTHMYMGPLDMPVPYAFDFRPQDQVAELASEEEASRIRKTKPNPTID